MLLRPDGSALSLDLYSLRNTPVYNYALPGLFVGVLYGLFPLVLASLYRSGEPIWQRLALAYLAASLLWIVTEQVIWHLFDWAHLVFIVLNGTTLVLLTRRLYIPSRGTQK